MRKKKKARQAPERKNKPWLVVLAAVPLLTLLWIALWFAASRSSKPAAAKKPSAAANPYRASDAAVFAAYAGSASCRECHEKAFNLWLNSHHQLAERPVDPALDRVAFDPAQVFRHGSQTSEVRLVEGKLQIVTQDLDGQRKPFVPERVIGVNPLRQFLVASYGGRLQTTEIAYDPHKGDWFNVFGEEDRRPGEWGHWTGRGMTWNNMCANCHNTALRKNYHEPTDTYHTAMVEMGVGCEACHGPMADHVAWQREHKDQKGDPTLRPMDRHQILAICGSCHSRRAELTADFVPGEAYFDHFSLTIPDETDIFYPDGQVRDEDYEYTSFLSSKMHLAGVRCLDCHDPHSMKTVADGDALCMRCHGPPVAPAPKIDPLKHSFHKPGESGSRCVECHMPITVYMARHPRHDHGFTIPDPLLTREHGIPNACNRCHQDKTVEWSIEAVEKWYGPRMERPSRTRAQVVAQARAGQRSAIEGLLKITHEEKNPLWRAVATRMLLPWCAETNVTTQLLQKTADQSPLVRAIAARALEPLSTRPDVRRALEQLLQDPVRLVRIDAAWAFRGELDLDSKAGKDLLGHLRHNLDQPSGALQMGVFHLDRGQIDTALTYFRRAVSWDTNSAALHHALAVGLSQKGQVEEALRSLETACRLAPNEAEFRYKLGLALNEVGRLPEATAALEQAVRLDPRFTQAWYNLGLAYSAQEKPERALEALIRAESIDTQSARIPYARATVLARVGRLQEARLAARRALELQPAFADAAALLQHLSQRGE